MKFWNQKRRFRIFYRRKNHNFRFRKQQKLGEVSISPLEGADSEEEVSPREVNAGDGALLGRVVEQVKAVHVDSGKKNKLKVSKEFEKKLSYVSENVN